MALPALYRRRQTDFSSTQPEIPCERIEKWTHAPHNIKMIELQQSLLGHDGCVNALCWSLDGRYLFSGSDDSTICVWRVAGDGSRIGKLRTGFNERVFDLKVMPVPNDHLLVACSMDYTIKVFDIGRILARADAASTHTTTSRPALSDILEVGDCCVRTFAVHSAPVKRIAVMYDQPHEFLSCSEDGTARHFDLREPLPAPASAPALRHRHAGSTRGGHIVANYQTLHAELHALDTNPFQSSIFAVGGSITSIMVHDRRMPQLGSAHDVQRNYYSNWSGDKCIVRLRRNASPSEDDVFERISDSMVTGLRFSRDIPNQVIGSWCYDYVYLFDLNLSSAYMSATRTLLCEAGKRSRSRAVVSDSQSPPTVKRVRSGSRVPEHPSPVDASSSGGIGGSDNRGSALNHRARDFTRGRSLGVRILTREEAPYLFTSDDLNESSEHSESSESTDSIQTGSSDCQVSHTAISYDAGVSSDSFVMDCSSAVNASHCKVCQADTGVLKTAIIRLETVGIRASDPDLALTATERSLVDIVFRTFVASMVANTLPQALDAMTFACRQLEDEGAQPSERALRALVPLEEIANSGDKTRLRSLLMAFHTDAGLDRERVRSIFHNNRTCIHSTLFRQKWSQRFHGHSNPNVDPLSSRAASELSNNLRDIRSDLEAAFRDNSAALRLNRYNMLARYNRVLLAWDSARLDTLLFLLALQPLVGSINDPQLNMMRAEFGDLSYRLGELRSKIGSSSDIVCEESRTFAGFCNAVGLTDDGDAGEYILKCLFHENERFFEMPKRLGDNLLCEVKIVADRFEAAYRAFAGNAFAGSSSSEYAAAATQLEQCWSSLTQTQTSDLPYAYLWHRYIPSISERRNGGCEELENVGIDIMPAFPLNAPFSCTGFGHSIAASPTSDERMSITDSSSSRSRSNYNTGDDSGSDSDGDSESSIGAHIRPRFYSGQIDSDALAMPPSEGDWPRDTCEYLPRHIINRTVSNSSHYTTDSSSHSGLADIHSSDAGLKSAVPVVLPCRRYMGHCNFQTTKDVNYLFGQYVASGSDDGRLFVWDKETMGIVQVITGDSEIVNIVEGHPYLPIVAVSGIDSEVHIFSLAKGGPVAAHRTNFPLVRGWQLAETNLVDQSSKAAYIEMVYAQDPYQSALQYSGHFTLPPGIDSSRLARSVPRTFPTVSESCLGDMAQIISQNEDMRLSNMAHASLTNQIMTNMLLGNLFGNSESGDDSAGSSDSGSSSGSDDSGGLGSHSGMHTASTANSINAEGNVNGNSDGYDDDDDDDDDEEGDGSVILVGADMREHTDGSEYERAAESIIYQEAQQRRRRRLRWVHRHFGGTGSTSEESESRFSPELDGSTLH